MGSLLACLYRYPKAFIKHIIERNHEILLSGKRYGRIEIRYEIDKRIFLVSPYPEDGH